LRDSLARRETFRAALDEAGIPHGEEMEYVGNFLPPSGYDAVSAFLDERALKCEAIVCANDLMAIGVWNAIIKRGMNVPFDIAVTGYDDSQLSHALSNQFTTVRQSFDRLGYLAAKRLHALTRGETLGPFEPLATELRIRSSCGCVEFEKRPNTLAEKNDRVLSERMRENIVDFVRRESPASESAGIYRLWTNTVLGMLREHRPVYELEEMLRETRKSLFDNGISNWDNSLLLNLYALMLDACGQTVFVKFWRDAVFSTDLRVILDRIQDSLTKNVSLSAHYGMFKGITDHCNAKEFHIARFADFSNPDAGASAVYTTTPDWKPGPGSWFPGEGHSIVANMIANADYRYGYFLLDADVPVTSTFDYLRIRFSNVSKDLLNLKSIYELNAELVRQVAEREEAELRLKDALTMVEQLSVEDELTGLRNRRGFYALAEQQIKYLRREKSSFFVVYADLDGLKAINDKWGHQDGDLAIRAAAEALKGALRDSDIVARMGGDEFTALVNKSEPPNYEIIKRRILEACEQKTRELAKPWSLSISIGHYHSHADCALSLREMLELADANLYGVKQKKKAGRKG